MHSNAQAPHAAPTWFTQFAFKFYDFTNRIPFLKSYAAKFLFVAFLGTHVPLISLIAFATVQSNSDNVGLSYLIVTLLATLIGTAITFLALKLLLTPLSKASESMQSYLQDAVLPSLPEQYNDEVGSLMRNVQRSLFHLDGLIIQTRQASTVDTLTGLTNRGFAQRLLEQEILAAQKDQSMFTLYFVDANSLKLVNDSYGHAAGDECLALISSALSRNIRQGDWCARWGGDEFIVVLKGKSAISASYAARLVAYLEQHPLRLSATRSVPVSVSLGSCEYAPGLDALSMVAAADATMYEAKRAFKAGI